MKLNRNKIKEKRKKLGLTLQQVADYSRSSKSYIWEIENRRVEPSGTKLILLSKTLGESPEWFYDEKILDPTKNVVGTLITWLGQSSTGVLSPAHAKKLLNELHGEDEQKIIMEKQI